MYRKRLILNSIRSLSKVCRTHQSDSFRALGFVRTLGATACETCPSEFNGGNFTECQQNPSRFNGENRTNVGFNGGSEAYGGKLTSQNFYGYNREWRQLARGNSNEFCVKGGDQGEIIGTPLGYALQSGGFQANAVPSYVANSPGNYQQTANESWNRPMDPPASNIFNANGEFGGAEKSIQSRGTLQSGGYQQNAVPSYVANSSGNYQQTANESWNRPMDPPASNIFNANGEFGGAEKSIQSRGTLEELDALCRDAKLKEAVEVLGLLQRQGITLDLARYLTLMRACGEAKALEEAKHVHDHLIRSISSFTVSTYNKILEMYGKCGSMEDAYNVFDNMPQRNLTSWDTMITWLAKNGLGEDAIELFTEFKKLGLKPDGQMFIGVFAACSVLGDITEGMLHFESMSKDYGIVPSMKHYISVVDMLGSAGCLDEALEFIQKMPIEPTVDVWETLMNLCRVYGNMELGDRCAELIELIEPSHLNEQSKAGLIPVKASDLAKEKEKKKLAAENLLAVRSRVHEYRAGDTSHPEKDKIYALLRGMKEQMKEAGYIAETRFVLHDIDREGKEEALLAHSERLAVAYGLISSPVRAPIRIIKNLRVCGDCHSALKIISEIVGRELIIRDAKRFHHFKGGLCSCRDYW